MRLERGELSRLMIFMPPRTSKSTITSIYFPAWCLGRHPLWQWIGISHGEELARKFGREVRDLVSSDMFEAVFPTITVSRTNSAADDWVVQRNGRNVGSYKAAGTGTKIAGHGADVISIDDPISEQDAFSEAKRNSINEWYPGGLRSRLQPHGRIVLTMTRWQEADLAGTLRSLADENPLADQWEILELPATVTEKTLAPLKRATEKLKDQGYLPQDYPPPILKESFWPRPSTPDGTFYWPTSALLATKESLPDYQWDAIYMQSPSALDGGILKPSYWVNWSAKEPPSCDYVIQSYDTAFSQRDTADFSAVTTWGVFYQINTETEDYDPHLILLGAEKGRWSYPELRERTILNYREWKPDAVLIEKKASGQSLIQDLRGAYLPIFEYNPDRDKISRAHAVAGFFHTGQIFAPVKKKWAQDVIEECRQFPNGRYKDYVDTTTQAVLWFRDCGWVHNPRKAWNVEDDYDKLKRKDRTYY